MTKIIQILTIAFILVTQSFATEAELQGKDSSSGKKFSFVTVDFPPYYGKDLPENGWVAEVVRAALEGQGYEVEIKFVPWSRAIKYTKEGYYDALLGAYYTEERAESYYFSAPISQARTGFFKRKDKTVNFKELTDLKEYRLGVVKDYATSKAFDAADYLNKVMVTSSDVGIKMLYHGSLDLMTDTEAAVLYLAEHVLEQEETGISEQIEFIKPVLAMNKMYVAISKKAVDADLKLIDFNQGLRTIYLDGTFRSIKAKHKKLLKKMTKDRKKDKKDTATPSESPKGEQASEGEE